MRNFFLLASMLFIFCQFADAQRAGRSRSSSGDPEVITGHLVKVTKPLRDFKSSDHIAYVKVRDLDGIVGKDEAFEEGEGAPLGVGIVRDAALQSNYPNLPHGNGVPTPQNAITNNFAGIGNQPLNPPDPTMAVGPNHIIQMINGSSGALLQIYNKAGTILVAAKFLDAITGKGGLGDPIALYDQLADRIFLAEFNNTAEP